MSPKKPSAKIQPFPFMEQIIDQLERQQRNRDHRRRAQQLLRSWYSCRAPDGARETGGTTRAIRAYFRARVSRHLEAGALEPLIRLVIPLDCKKSFVAKGENIAGHLVSFFGLHENERKPLPLEKL